MDPAVEYNRTCELVCSAAAQNRGTKLSQSFNNYRRTTKYKLNKRIEQVPIFKALRANAALKSCKFCEKYAAEPNNFTEEDLAKFHDEVVTFRAQTQSRAREVEEMFQKPHS